MLILMLTKILIWMLVSLIGVSSDQMETEILSPFVMNSVINVLRDFIFWRAYITSVYPFKINVFDILHIFRIYYK